MKPVHTLDNLFHMQRPSLQQDHQTASNRLSAMNIRQHRNRVDRHIDWLVIGGLVLLILSSLFYAFTPIQVTPVQQEVRQ